jgi:hypothetical protein
MSGFNFDIVSDIGSGPKLMLAVLILIILVSVVAGFLFRGRDDRHDGL